MNLYFYVDMDGVLVNLIRGFKKAMPVSREEDDWLWEDFTQNRPSYLFAGRAMPGAEQL